MVVAILVIGVITFLIYVKWRQTYWTRRGLPTAKTEFFFGDMRKAITGVEPLAVRTKNRYNEIKALGVKHAGFYMFWRQIYFPVDLQIIKNIMQQDADYFQSHGGYYHSDDVLSTHLFTLENQRWKELRAKLTPAFTSGKIKMMFETLTEKTELLIDAVGKLADETEGFAIKNVCGNFTTDVIASCGFGIECDSLNEPDNAFRNFGKKLLVPNLLRFALTNIVNWNLLVKLGFTGFGSKTSQFFIDLVKDTIKHREDNEVFRKDFMHLLLQLKNQGIISDKTNVNRTKSEAKGILSENDIIGQCFVFFVAGFETSSSTMTFTMLELAQNQDIQDKLRKEIKEVLAKHDGKLTYEAAMEMPYLDKVVNEALRKFPPLPFIPRKCTRNYKIPGTDVVLEKGTGVHIPVWGIHNDPEYFPNPDVFDPERFSEKNKASRPEYSYLPFGAGPRICIGLRFGKLQAKVGLIALLNNFKFTLNEKTPMPIQIDRGFIITVKGNVWVDAVRL
uniref:Cytochrome P450 CYP6BW2 n=1 Tax=Dendroctonus ponderosae TaxID=77166 RepID=I1VJ41_DENPD|nr:cytochrome P450 CYP6BW2 [Dendroctonus ponderosae]